MMLLKDSKRNLLDVDFPVEFFPTTTLILAISNSALLIGPKLLMLNNILFDMFIPQINI